MAAQVGATTLDLWVAVVVGSGAGGGTVGARIGT